MSEKEIDRGIEREREREREREIEKEREDRENMCRNGFTI